MNDNSLAGKNEQTHKNKTEKNKNTKKNMAVVM
jgi:hypothetical protein